MGAVAERVITCPLLDLDNEFPDKLYVLHHPASDRYGCFCHDGVHGVATFSTEGGAIRFSEWIDLAGMKIDEMTFDEVREVAKGRPMPVTAVMLLDRIEQPRIHFVK